jgi:integrase
MKWNDIRNGAIAVLQEKTGTHLLIPIHAELANVLERIPRVSVYVLTNTSGRPWTKDGFRTSWNKATSKIELSEGAVFHGLRKSAVITLLEAGCTDAEVAAVTGQSRQMVEHYSKDVNRRRLARSAISKWENS